MAPARKTSDQQLTELLDFMDRNEDIARSKVPHSPAGKEALMARWTDLAKQLNAMGYSRSPPYWRTYWHELKYKTKLKAMKVKKSIINGENVRLPKFTDFEVRLLGILGVDVPKRPRSPIPFVESVRKKSQSAVDPVADPHDKPETIAVQWEHKFMETKMEPEFHENMEDENDYEDSFLQRLHNENGNYVGSDDSACPRSSEDTNVLAWAHQLEKRRIDGEHRLADAMFAIAKSQSEMAQAQRHMADALHDIRRDIRTYLRPESQDHAVHEARFPEPQQ